jgi:hypothetical protein
VLASAEARTHNSMNDLHLESKHSDIHTTAAAMRATSKCNLYMNLQPQPVVANHITAFILPYLLITSQVGCDNSGA